MVLIKKFAWNYWKTWKKFGFFESGFPELELWGKLIIFFGHNFFQFGNVKIRALVMAAEIKIWFQCIPKNRWFLSSKVILILIFSHRCSISGSILQCKCYIMTDLVEAKVLPHKESVMCGFLVEEWQASLPRNLSGSRCSTSLQGQKLVCEYCRDAMIWNINKDI